MQILRAFQQNPLYILWIWLGIINLVTFVAMGVDKYKASHKKWRIPEKTLILLAAVGGSIGGILGMYAFHHKTLHRKFSFGFPIILFLQLFVAAFIYMNMK